ncbi:MAG: hypothetical protein AAGG51_23405 [Cyanobacteria bacterium P01_G01_bin.54]
MGVKNFFGKLKRNIFGFLYPHAGVYLFFLAVLNIILGGLLVFLFINKHLAGMAVITILGFLSQLFSTDFFSREMERFREREKENIRNELEKEPNFEIIRKNDELEKYRKQIDSLRNSLDLHKDSDEYYNQQSEYMARVRGQRHLINNIANYPEILKEDILEVSYVRDLTVRTLDVIRLPISSKLPKSKISDDPLWEISMEASLNSICSESVGLDKNTEDILEEYFEYCQKAQGEFDRDLYIYLKAWLIVSVKYGKPMNHRYIQQTYPTPDNPDKELYIEALKEVKEIIKGDFLNKFYRLHTDIDEFIESSKRISSDFLEILIGELEEEL